MKTSLKAPLILLPFILGGCSHVPIYEHQRVSKPGMTFSDSPIENTNLNLASQIEPGSAATGGAQAAGCTSCR